MSLSPLLLSLSPFWSRPALPILACLLGWLTPLMLSGQECPPPVPLSPPWLTPPSELYQHHAWVDGQLTSAKVYVLPGGPEAFRPFVFVEGIDFGLSGEASPWRNGDFGWSEFWGCDPVGYPMMASMPTLVDSLVHRGFTPVLIDFEDGDADLFVNAELLIDILEHLRDHRTDPRPMVVSGASMGGQLARIALRTMELRGEPTCTALYVSLDSPHQGANVPIGLQQLLHFLEEDGSPALHALLGALQSPAARQLLLRQVPSLTPRILYQDSLNALGLPQDGWSASISNGSTLPLPGGQTPLLVYEHALIESGWLGDIGNILHLQVHAHPGWPDHPDAVADWGVTADVHTPSDPDWPWPLDEGTALAPLTDLDLTGPLDRSPGGTRPSMLQFATAFNAHIEGLDLPWPVCLPPIEPEQLEPLHSFIPTSSALGIPPPWTLMVDPVEAETNSPFDAIHIAATNEAHSEINDANITFLLEQMDRTQCPLAPGTALSDTILLAEEGWRLSPLVVEGRLALHSADTTLCSPAAEPLSHGEFTVDGCSGGFQVSPGGTLELGGGVFPDSFSTAMLTLTDGGQLVVEGALVLHAGSELRVEAGTELRFEDAQLDLRQGSRLTLLPGALLTMEGHTLWIQHAGSVVQLEGHGDLGSGALWQCSLLDDAQWSTQHAFDLAGASDAEVALSSPGSESIWILGPHADAQLQGFGSWMCDGVQVRMSGSGRFFLSATQTQHWSSTWSGTATDTMTVSGPLSLSDHQAHHLHVAQQNGTFQATDSQFIGGSTMATGRLQLSDCHFQDHPLHHDSPHVGPPHLIQDCTFEDGMVGLASNSIAPLRLERCQFDRLALGVSVQGMRCEMACCAFRNNDVGTLSNRSLLALTPSEGGGWCRFEDNDVHLRFLQSEIPLWTSGANFFGTWGSHWAQGSFGFDCQGPVDIDATGQSWAWPSSWPQVQSGLWATSVDGMECPVNVVDLAPVPEQECRLGEGKKRE